MLTIRLTRKGKKNQPFYRVVLVDKRKSSKGGRSVEDLGYVNPLTKKNSFNAERIKYWISKGAQPSETIHNWLVSEKIIDDKKIHVAKISPKKQAEINKAKADAEAAAKAKAEADEAAKKAAQEAKAAAEAKPEELPAAPQEPKSEEQKPEETPAQ